jgi:hypothetical protein
MALFTILLAFIATVNAGPEPEKRQGVCRHVCTNSSQSTYILILVDTIFNSLTSAAGSAISAGTSVVGSAFSVGTSGAGSVISAGTSVGELIPRKHRQTV